jgi:limonene-1,2-epoxide hydrolase
MKATTAGRGLIEEHHMDRRHFIQGPAVAALLAVAGGAAARDKSGSKKLERVTALVKDWRRKDIEAVLARVTDDIVWFSHVGSPPINGKAAMRQVLTSLGAGMNDVRWRIFDYAENDKTIFLEGVDDFVSAEGHRVVIPYAGLMTFRDGLVAEWRDYFDRAVFNKLKAGEAMPDYLEKLANRKALF